MEDTEKIVQTPFGTVKVRVKKGTSPSYHESPFIRKKMEEAERTLRGLKVPLSE